MIKRKIIEILLNQYTSINNSNSSGIVNLHRLDTGNVGDLMCAPYLYFKELQDYRKLDILSYEKSISDTIKFSDKLLNNDIVVGGGGLLDRKTFKAPISITQKLAKKGTKVIYWGIGHNNPNLTPSNLFLQQIDNIPIVGIRDYNVKIKNVDWVPCVSCMNDVFDKTREIENEVSFLIHEHIPIDGIDNTMPILYNNSTFEQIIEFISKTETLVTNSYHGMYWATLLEKKVIVIPNSSKMYSMKYEIPKIKDVAEYKAKISSAHVISGFLEECREANLKFSEKVFNYLNI
ncbi:polysaccharide pyruvyl transferase family protein [Flammeovirga sp. SubArs3]|uniref:polysaccharide pyruvyl transferase family protein n=1 Tax=Flammeovirga sp. SubArs3 TaxID=2995316 RepID=UPI00248BF5F3|nr:polysaccharide pyruvyl transferase family protein [Flammeovirga sp. SubArs3]